MSRPIQRRRDPMPITRSGEFAMLLLGGAAILVSLAALAGLGVAAALFGGGWVWPRGANTIGSTIGGLATGHAGRGLPPEQAAAVPGAGVVYGCVALCEFALATTTAALVALIVRYHRPSDARGGMASRREAREVLGLRQLRTNKALIRPDLYSPTKPTSPSWFRTKEVTRWR